MIIECRDEDFAALLAGEGPRGLTLPEGGIEGPEVLAMLRTLAARIEPQFSPCAWMMVEDGEVVGLCSIVKPPSDGVIDIGYGVSPARRRRGVATSAVAAVLAWAEADDRVTTIQAETSVDNPASQGVLARNQFEVTGRRTDDEDGELICWRRRLRD